MLYMVKIPELPQSAQRGCQCEYVYEACVCNYVKDMLQYAFLDTQNQRHQQSVMLAVQAVLCLTSHDITAPRDGPRIAFCLSSCAPSSLPLFPFNEKRLCAKFKNFLSSTSTIAACLLVCLLPPSPPPGSEGGRVRLKACVGAGGRQVDCFF